ncbi:MAG TPA: hypothetical protein VMU27_00065 [Candidatus Paceibacterota bacterium]|nr:hypothetical protein [Candidatus Paceibacterota bacterium]
MGNRMPCRGITLISAVVAVAIFALISLAAYGALTAIIRDTNTLREQVVISSLADRYMEIARNLPYSQIGTLSGNPPGMLPDLPNAASTTVNGTTYDIYYDVTYVDDPADGLISSSTDYDPNPNDYKQVRLNIQNMQTGVVIPFVTTMVPKGLEGLANGGALAIKVFNAVGQPVPNASITIVNNSLSPHLNLLRTTDANGNWTEVGLPDSVNSYSITATKSGYSSDQTYAASSTNPNPTKPYATISNGQVTQISFSIDQVSSLQLNLVNATCQPINGVGVELRGQKLIGTPNVYKFDNTYTSKSNGAILLPALEWDTYTPAVVTPSYMIYGSSPIQQINVLPGTNEQSELVLGPTTANSLLVDVKDASTGNPIRGATVELMSTSPSYDTTLLTEGSTWTQADWSGGSGQQQFTVSNQYYQDDGNVDTQTLPTGLRLVQGPNGYVSSGSLESSTFDTGTGSTTYTTIAWTPTSQSASTSVAFQIATNNDNATWNYLGPDGTVSTYYTVPNTSIYAGASNNRYIRYKTYLSSLSTTTTPVLSSVNLNYVSGCAAPGQAMFAGLQAGNNYTLIVSMSGYTTQTITNLSINGYNTLEVDL